MSELKPCPFCGGSVTLTVMIGDWYEDGEDTGLSSYGWSILHSKHNRECSSTRGFSSEAFLDAACRESEEAKQKLITAWNTRHVETCTIGDYKDPDYGYTHDAMWNDEWFVPSGRCSGCGEYIPVWNYCPKCGRKVEGC